MIKIIAAKTTNNIIGQGNRIPWHSPQDFSWFKKQTTGHIVLMGRKTFESMGSKPLKDRTNIVVSSNPIDIKGVLWFNSIDKALYYSKAENPNDKDLWVLGGSLIYKHFMEGSSPLADKLVITEFFVSPPTDNETIMFPEINPKTWMKVSSTVTYGVDEQFRLGVDKSVPVMNMPYTISEYNNTTKIR